MRKGFIIVALCALSMSLWAWGPKGHRIIAEVAYMHLSKRATKQVDKVLGQHGMIAWVNWADEIKSDTIYPSSYDWHFQDLNGGMSDEEVVATLRHYPSEGGNMWRAIDSIKTVLTADRTNVDAMRFFIHLVGDSYCPMHVAHMDDKGGNTVKMKWFGEPTNLHRVWDENMIESRGFGYKEYAQFLSDKYDVGKKKAPQMQSRAEDLIRTYHLTEAIYAFQEEQDTNTYHYIYRFKDAMEWQLYVAGIRLANELEWILR